MGYNNCHLIGNILRIDDKYDVFITWPGCNMHQILIYRAIICIDNVIKSADYVFVTCISNKEIYFRPVEKKNQSKDDKKYFLYQKNSHLQKLIMFFPRYM